MKGPNPFAPWNSDPESMCGRKDETKAFTSFAGATAAKQGGVMLVRGGPGSGKSALLRLFAAEAEKAGLLAPLVRAERGEGLDSVADKVSQELFPAGAAGPSGAGGPGPWTRGGGGRAAPAAAGAQAAAHGVERMALDAERAAKKSFGCVILIDDFDSMRKPKAMLAKLLKASEAAWGRRAVSFAVGATKPLDSPSELLRKMELGPFGEHEAREVVEKALKKGPPKMGEECLLSVLADSGGNPRLFKAVCYIIYDKLRDNEKVISKGHYLAYLPQIMGSLSREWFGAIYQETPESERAVLKTLSLGDEGMHVSDIAKKLRKPLGPVTALVGRLMDRGQIVRLGRGKYRVFSKLYGRYVGQRS
jgi:hypothetical protein